eukprot:XP_020407589.1 vegetative cell wall protein gp1-like [Zea mays]
MAVAAPVPVPGPGSPSPRLGRPALGAPAPARPQRRSLGPASSPLPVARPRPAQRGRARPCSARSRGLRLGAAWPWRCHGARSRCGLGGARGAPARPVQRAVPPASLPHPRFTAVALGPGVCVTPRPSRSPAPHAAPSARAVGNRRRLPRGPHLSGPSPAQTHLSLVPCSPPLPCPARPARPRCSPPPARAVRPRPCPTPSPHGAAAAAPLLRRAPRHGHGAAARRASPPAPRPIPVLVPRGARRRSFGSVCGHGGRGARARARLPFPASRPAGTRRARPSLAAFAQPGVQPPPRGSASPRPARSPARSRGLRLGAAWPWRPFPARLVQRAVPPASSLHPRFAAVALGPGVCATRQCGLAHSALARLAVPSARSSTP